MSSPTPSRLEFDAATLERFLRLKLPGLQGGMRLQRIGGGQSNPTFFVDFDNRRLVLRKQPGPDILPGAHAVDREARIMHALAATDVPVPVVLFFHAERDIVGTPFYVMECLEGRVFASYELPGVTPAERRQMYRSMAETLARLHNVDFAAIGLGDYGKPGNYFQRQINRWGKQWRDTKVSDNPSLERLLEWLPANIPPGDESSIAHGDYRAGNLMFHPTEPRVIAVLDWELSTLGHPLADLAYHCIAWHTAADEYYGLRGLELAALGIPSEAEHIADYYRVSRRQEPIQQFHFVFALFRIAVIFEGIAARARQGIAVADNAEQVGRLGAVFSQRAMQLVDGA
ncbi:MAG: phosphotransferase family protein [Hydrocarboniphaga sp.]|uniref:phosphotransferase family protein n=1 Tax=Hydrocarboniphaga sp. TaxID=2033016 RepID=UPI00261118E1|nr:phosphotransferase family protein [Hydrocarboniphaga sp.]MDB5971001.1 phosphotransferase family protein [Hydrocarboniphaga sp.]